MPAARDNTLDQTLSFADGAKEAERRVLEIERGEVRLTSGERAFEKIRRISWTMDGCFHPGESFGPGRNPINR
ncbi:hypothetical protein HYR69_07350 [Candidatus Sumerlaeota bacterium]|nr:hypothetical protein [Candidatus Sumerlaeota bacterium]MBI3736584.1 hypothetical protein [Candidatus Sumerlaeota bacterium]